MNPGVAAAVLTAREQLRERWLGMVTEWSDLAVVLGKAEVSAERGDVAETRQWLRDASDLEYALFGDADATARPTDLLDPEATP